MRECDCNLQIKHDELKERFQKDHEALNQMMISMATIKEVLPRIEAKIESTQQGINHRLDVLNGQTAKNTTHREKSQAVIENWKFWAGFVGIGNFGALIYMFLTK